MRPVLLVLLALLPILVVPAAEAPSQPSPPPAAAKPADAKPVDVKAKFRAVLAEAQKANDLWTILQLEAYGQQKLGIKPSPVLGASELLGNPLFAFPANVQTHWDRGDYVGVVAGERFYLLAPDGRPLAPSTPLAFASWASSLSFDGKWLGLARMIYNAKGVLTSMELMVRGVPNGAEGKVVTLDVATGEWFNGSSCVAPDGGAVAIAIRDKRPRLAIARADGKGETIGNITSLLGLGPSARWFLAEQAAGKENRLCLFRGAEGTPVLAGAVGPGIGAVLTGPAATPVLQLVNAKGELVTLEPSIGLGDNASLVTVGRWLVVGSGWGAKSPATTDLLGNVVPGKGGQPFTTFAYRWDDLLADPQAQPAFQTPRPYNVASGEAAGLYLWAESALALADLSGHEPVERPLFTARERIDWVNDESHRIRVHLPGWQVAVLDVQGKELWSGPAVGCSIQDRNWMVLCQGKDDKDPACTFAVVNLGAEPAKRVAVPLQLDPGAWEIELDRFGRWAIAAQNKARWVELDMATGKARRTFKDWDPDKPPLRIARHWDGRGRFYQRCARLFDKLNGETDELGRRWHPKDAWCVGPVLLVLDQYDHVLTPGKKRGSFIDLGECAGADQFAVRKNEPMLQDGDQMLIAAFAPGPALVRDFPGKGGAAEVLPPGPWRVTRHTFAAPHSGSLAWSVEKTGFLPAYLRSPSGVGNLLVVTQSLLIDLDAEAAKVVGATAKGPPQ
jgi:hypothetical protein